MSDTRASHESKTRRMVTRPRIAMPEVLPLIRREGIDWRGGIDGAPLEIRLTLENPGSVRSTPTTAEVGIAAFGAFVPWRPLATVTVPGVPPGGRIVLTATGHDESPERDAVEKALNSVWSAASALDLVSWFKNIVQTTYRWAGGQGPTLNPVHFVGNLNVFVTRGEAVERHQNRSIGLRPRHGNLVIFSVGDGRDDSYSFHLDAEPGWNVELAGCRWETPTAISSRWIAAAITPPRKAEQGRVVVWVERHSTGEEVPVEFDLAVDARRMACGTVVG